MFKEQIYPLLDSASWRFAKTMKTNPHEYTLRDNWDSAEFDAVVLFIRENGVKERFFRSEFIYYYYGNHKYWTMGNPIDMTKLINRAEIK